ncbi:MAG: tRNA (adenosine(37)-N6)-threonylcarbamoyltransferase complex ATPase subunit type 1 TsaE [Xanthomonadales bacterium]|nr:tRNA (adenosine(37)-N6)-threonylcarbamoyltransferase complex ATPase subunit type 1 TsaE [Xanthomonadales bacterium]
MSARVPEAPRRLSLELEDEVASLRLGQRLAATLPARAVVHLQGDLGAGKTTLARALLRALGVEGAIKSPTYTLIERYPVEGGEVAHLDLYRIADPEELSFLGLDELADSARLWLVEWAERGAAFLPSPDLRIRLAVAGAGRRADLEALSEEGARWLVELSAQK